MCLKRSLSISVREQTGHAIRKTSKEEKEGGCGCLLAASRKPWCSCIVKSGSGSSRSQSFRTLVTLLISPDHSSASRFVVSKSVQGTHVRQLASPRLAQKTIRRHRTFIEFILQPRDLAHRPANSIDAHGRDTVLLDRLATFDHDGRHLDTVTRHLIREVDAKRGSDPIGQLRIAAVGRVGAVGSRIHAVDVLW